MKFNRTWLTAGVTAAVLAAAGVGGAALATSESQEITDHAEVEDEANGAAQDEAEDESEGEDTPITDEEALATASAKALAWLEAEHGVTGTVTDTEVGDEESHYEIEVTLEDGRHVDVQLTDDFEVVGLD